MNPFSRYTGGYHTLFWMMLTVCVFAQDRPGRTTAFLKKNILLSGQVRSFGELYDVQGANPRRPPSTGRIMMTPTLTFSKLFSVSADLLLSTEGSQARQNMNIFSLHPTWSWGRAHVGDFSMNFSKYTFTGVNVKGAGAELNPGWLRFSAGGGYTKRAVAGNLINQSYDQTLYTGKLGFQVANGSFLDFIALKIKDDPLSVKTPEPFDYDPVIVDTLETELDTVWIEPPYHPQAITPQDNFIAGLAGRIQLMDKRVMLDFEGSGSAYTKDLSTAVVPEDSIDVPALIHSALSPFFTPRRGSRYDVAMRTDLNVRFRHVAVKAGYRMVGPGYISLGMPSTANDRREWMLSTQFRIAENRLHFGWNCKSDNLLDQKQSTNIRNQFRAGLDRNGRRFRSSFNLNLLRMNNETDRDSLAWDYDNLIFNTQQTWITPLKIIRQIGGKYTYQRSNKRDFASKSISRYQTLQLTVNGQLSHALFINGSVGISLRNSAVQGAYRSQVYTFRINHQAMQRKWTNALLVTSSMVRDTDVFRAGWTSVYQLTARNRIQFNLFWNRFTGTQDFRELRSTLSLSHRF